MKIKQSRIYSLILLKLKDLLFPPELHIEGNRITLRTQDSLIFFWDSNEDSVFLRDVTTINYNPGILWDRLVLDSRSGMDSLVLRGIKKGQGKKFKEALLQVTR